MSIIKAELGIENYETFDKSACFRGRILFQSRVARHKKGNKPCRIQPRLSVRLSKDCLLLRKKTTNEYHNHVTILPPGFNKSVIVFFGLATKQ